MNIVLDGNFSLDGEGTIISKSFIPEIDSFKITIIPTQTQIMFPDGDLITVALENQNEFYQWVKEGPAEFYWGIDGFTIKVEIDIPLQKKKFKLALHDNNGFWVGFESEYEGIMKKYPYSNIS